MKKTFVTFVMLNLISLVASMSAFADCRQAHLVSSDGTQIYIDYSQYNQTNGDSAWLNPRIHVVLPNDKCVAQEVVVQLVRSQFGFSSSQPQTLSRDGENACEFSATVNNVEIANHGGSLGQAFAAQVIFSDGSSEWLVDPVTKSNNFNYAYQTTGYSPDAENCQ
jgi:hypothetical protein